MNEIKYRARLIDPKTDKWIWIYRQPFHIRGTWFMYNSVWDKVRIDHRTTGQYTGQKDKDGKEIYEGDVWEGYKTFVVNFDNDYGGYLPFVTDGGCGCCSDGEGGQKAGDGVVIGNIYENPDLLEVGDFHEN